MLPDILSMYSVLHFLICFPACDHLRADVRQKLLLMRQLDEDYMGLRETVHFCFFPDCATFMLQEHEGQYTRIMEPLVSRRSGSKAKHYFRQAKDEFSDMLHDTDEKIRLATQMKELVCPLLCISVSLFVS
jgi:hypothetical protein